MDIREHLLSCLAEECAEVAQDCSKMLRFGSEDVHPHKPEVGTNKERLIVELNQLLAVVHMLTVINELPEEWRSVEVQKEKIIKVTKYMSYAIGKGTLDKDSCAEYKKNKPANMIKDASSAVWPEGELPSERKRVMTGVLEDKWIEWGNSYNHTTEEAHEEWRQKIKSPFRKGGPWRDKYYKAYEPKPN